MKYIYLMLIALLLFGCTEGEVNEEQVEAIVPEAEVEDNTIKADIDGDDDLDVAVTPAETAEDPTEVVIELEEQEPVENFCVPGTTFNYASEDGTVDAKVLGLEQYKGSEFCKAESTAVISSPVGDITTDTIYYFDATQTEFWISTTTSGAALPQAQTNEVHIINGEVQ